MVGGKTQGMMFMPKHYAAVLREGGFVAESGDLRDVFAAFDYEINSVLFDDDSTFDMEKSETRRQPDDLKCLPSCWRYRKSGEPLDKSARYLPDKWYSWLRYENPAYDSIERITKADGAGEFEPVDSVESQGYQVVERI